MGPHTSTNFKLKQTGYVVLTDDKDNIFAHPEKVASMFIEYFINIAESIGNLDEVSEDTDTQSLVQRHSNHTSITWIKENVDTRSQFKFQHVTSDEVKKKMSQINSKKSVNGLRPDTGKMIKLGAQSLCTHIKLLINMCIDKCVFPSCRKKADVTPIHKKGVIHDKGNYRPESVLPCISKIFESILTDQLQCHFWFLFSDLMSGFRKGYSCQSVLANFVETFEQKLD